MSVISLHLIFDLAAIPIAYRMKLGDGSGFGLFALFGSLLGQTSMVAAYLAWGPGHCIARWLNSCFLIMLVWYAITVGAVSTGDSFEVSSIEQLLAIVVTLSFLCASILCWTIRGLSRNRFTLARDSPLAEPFKPRFRIADLLTRTTAVAIVCAILQSRIGRETWPDDWSMSSGDLATLFGWMSLWAALFALLAVPAVWACPGQHRPARRLLYFSMYAAVAVALEWAILHIVTGEAHLGIFAAALNLGVLCEVVPCAFLLRICGYRIACIRQVP
jgi:hypothetical protein